MTVAPQAEQEIVVGIVAGVLHKGDDRYQIEVNVGQQNPKRLWTKDAGVVQQMQAMLGQQLSFMCGVSHWTNNSGQAMRSLWINGFGQPGAMPAQQQQPVQQQTQPLPQQAQPVPQQWQQPQTAAQPAPSMPAQTQAAAPQRDLREEKIHRQTATKVAVDLLKYLAPEHHTFDTLITLSERLVAYYEQGVQWGGGENQGNPSEPAVSDGDPGPQGVPHTDDDIPF
jgi:hypothetical protein